MSTVLPLVERISSRVIRLLGLNPGPKTLQGTNTYLLGDGPSRVLVDAGEADKPGYVESLLAVLEEQKAGLAAVVVTHYHPDHVGGVCGVLAATQESLPVYRFPHAGSPLPPWVVVRPLHHGQCLEDAGLRLVVHHTPGHSPDHCALELEGPGGGIFTGDCVLGEGTTTVEHLGDYMASLRHLLSLCPADTATPLYPGHGPVAAEGAALLHRYIAHRQERERQVFTAVATLPGAIASVLTRQVYKDIPENLMVAAEGNLVGHLQKLCAEGRVVRAGDTYTCVEGD